MRLWRLSKPEDAERFDGGYGLHNEGRWNRLGQAVTYCASVPSLCVLEKLVHAGDVDLFPDVHSLVRYEAPDDAAVEVWEPGAPLADGWDDDEAATQALGAAWYVSLSTPLLRVPSVVVPSIETADRNYVVNHRHPDSARIRLEDIADYCLDARLLAMAKRAGP